MVSLLVFGRRRGDSMALWAINKKIYEDSIKEFSEQESINKAKCFSINAYTKFKGIFIDKKIISPEYKEFYGFNRITRGVIKEQKWTYVASFEKRKEDLIIIVRSFFTPSIRNSNYKSYDPNSEEDTHRAAQDILLAQFLEGTLNVHYHGIKIPINNFDISIREDVEKYLEQTKNFKELFEKGMNYKESRIADLLIEFRNWNEKFGKGIAFEIANTESEKSLKEKENDWTNGHYSYVPLDIKTFNLLDESIKQERSIQIINPFDKHRVKELELIHYQSINNEKQLKELTQFFLEFKEKINNNQEGYIQTKNMQLNELQNKLISLETNIQEKESLIKRFEENKDILINSTINKFKSELDNQSEDIVIKLKNIIKSKVDYNLIQDIENKIQLTNDFKFKLDKQIFSSCEYNRNMCLNIIKRKTNNYFEKLKIELKKEELNNGKDKTD